MRNVLMIREEPGLVSIPVEKAVYCENCETVSSSSLNRCGVCGSERVLELASLLRGPWEPGPVPPATPCVVLPVAA
jgi:hypothetical protein